MTKTTKEIPFKQWLHETATRLDISAKALEQRLYRKVFPYPPVRRVNSRVLFVQVEE